MRRLRLVAPPAEAWAGLTGKVHRVMRRGGLLLAALAQTVSICSVSDVMRTGADRLPEWWRWTWYLREAIRPPTTTIALLEEGLALFSRRR